jgi:rubrerythrin
MDKDILQSLNNFDRVWMRVSEYASDPDYSTHETPSNDAETLRSFIEGESKDLAFYMDLAGKCRTPGRTVINEIASDERRHLKKLQTEYFLLTGDSSVPRRSCPYTDGILSALRRAYIHETEGYSQYIKAAGETKIPRLEALYTELAADEKRHSEKIRKLIEIAIE